MRAAVWSKDTSHGACCLVPVAVVCVKAEKESVCERTYDLPIMCVGGVGSRETRRYSRPGCQSGYKLVSRETRRYSLAVWARRACRYSED